MFGIKFMKLRNLDELRVPSMCQLLSMFASWNRRGIVECLNFMTRVWLNDSQWTLA